MKAKYAFSDLRRDMTCPVVYAAIADMGGGVKFVKVGHTRELIGRLPSIQTGCPVQIGDVAYARLRDTDIARRAESLIHTVMKPYISQGEWFRFDLTDAEHKRVWDGAIPAVLNALVGKGHWTLKSVNYGEMREAANEARRRATSVRRKRHFARAKWDRELRANDKIKGNGRKEESAP